MQRLVEQNDCQGLFEKCNKQSVRQPQDKAHENWCCVKELIVLTDAETGDEVALIMEQTYREPKRTVRTVIQLTLGQKTYRLRIHP